MARADKRLLDSVSDHLVVAQKGRLGSKDQELDDASPSHTREAAWLSWLGTSQTASR